MQMDNFFMSEKMIIYIFMTIPLGYNVVGLTQGTGRMSFMQFVMAIDRCGGWQPLVKIRISPASWAPTDHDLYR